MRSSPSPITRITGSVPDERTSNRPWPLSRFSPSTINYRANIDAMKRAGVTDIIAISACGSFRRELYPGLFVLVDQFIDRTFGRQTSFFGTGCVAHVPMAKPVASSLISPVSDSAR